MFTDKPDYLKGYKAAEVMYKQGYTKMELEEHLLYERTTSSADFAEWDRGFQMFIDGLEG